MLRAFCSFLLIVVIASARTNAQEADLPWLSLKRLSVTADAAYHYNPWKKYNESMSLAQDAFRYDSYYQNPSGRFEKILGDASFGFSAYYRIISGLSVGLKGGFLTTGSTSLVSYNTNSDWRQSIKQEVQVNVPHYGSGLEYMHELGEQLLLAASASISWYRATFRFNYQYDFQGDSHFYSAVLRETTFGVTGQVDLIYKAFSPLSVIVSVDHRWLRFANLTGSGTFTVEPSLPYSSVYSHIFEARLGEANGYCGLIIRESDRPYLDIAALYSLWSRAPVQPAWTDQRPAALDLSGFGISLGVRYEL